MLRASRPRMQHDAVRLRAAGALLSVALVFSFGCSSADSSGSNAPAPGSLGVPSDNSGHAAEVDPGTSSKSNDGEVAGAGTPSGSTMSAPAPAGTTFAGSAPPSGPAPGVPAAGGIATGSGGATGSAGTTGASSAPVISGGSTPVSGSGGFTGTGNVLPQSGILTAGAWDDNLNYARFTEYRKSSDIAQLPGLLPLTSDEFEASHMEFAGTRDAKKTLDVSLVIDTTGSMGDELAYLQSEFLSMSKAIENAYPDAAQRWSLVLYRDTSDEYVVRYFDVRTDAEDFRKNLAAQSADGGGDIPESPERGLSQMAQLGWRADGDTARIAFWVADAPHHNDKAAAMAEAIRTAHMQDIHIYPVAASGVDDLTEDTMRSAAQITGGRYLFLTNDSGVGLDHKEPTIPCYYVTHLDDAILRMVDIELSGQYHEPTPAQVIRTGGDPQAGHCWTASGQQVDIF
jgi:hypothetical protein